MKKLMIAAAVAAMAGGAFAECAEEADCVFAYKLTISGKTTVSASVKGNASRCIEPECYAKPASFKYVGYVFGQTEASGSAATCDEGCGCNDFAAVKTLVWDNKTKKQIAGDFAFDLIDLVGTSTKSLKAEAVAKFNDLVLAGFGTYDTKKLVLKSLSGQFAGTLEAPMCSTCTYDPTTCEETCDDSTAQVFALCTLEKGAATAAPAYGKWTLKNDASATRKLTNAYDDEGTVLQPKGFVPAN